MPISIPSECASINSEVEDLEQQKAALQQELAEAPPSLKPFYLREIRRTGLELGRKRQELAECRQQNPPQPRPDLLAQTVIFNVNHATRKLGVAAMIKNVGRGNARGPFRIDLSVTLKKGGIITSIVHVFEVPAGITISGEPVLAPPDATRIRVDNPQVYVTESIDVPLHYLDETPSCRYDFEFLVDTEQVVPETNEANNRFIMENKWFTTPEATQRDTPFVIESSVS